ncbi:hypothetical protein [Albidovulum sediminis]|uniref:Uncharacterized protein n=1 Tax=Albidovulum sediminis TaxID=3066345 RepID=A0ABT2NRC2_9RHOB|nr:hypothetical protein [Defluviimonas sediminis]MCT8331488.1 hypothetical protein [Defluviimonas sediminis]
MKTFLHQLHQGRSGYLALMVFLLAYAATMALVIAPDQVRSAMDALRTWPFE